MVQDTIWAEKLILVFLVLRVLPAVEAYMPEPGGLPEVYISTNKTKQI
jgi:hypothetical protein